MRNRVTAIPRRNSKPKLAKSREFQKNCKRLRVRKELVGSKSRHRFISELKSPSQWCDFDLFLHFLYFACASACFLMAFVAPSLAFALSAMKGRVDVRFKINARPTPSTVHETIPPEFDNQTDSVGSGSIARLARDGRRTCSS
jgi:hypothetical protein